jgi:hypothetical protein
LEFAVQGLDPRTPAEATAQLQMPINPGSSTDAPIAETSHNIAPGQRLHLTAPHADDVGKNDAAVSTATTSDVIPDWGEAEDACPVTQPPAPDARTGSEHHGNQSITDIWKKNQSDSFRGFRPSGEHRIDLPTRIRTGQIEKGRPQPSVVYEHHTADALHLCLYACHTVLQPVLMARHRKDKEMIKTATAAGMFKWVQGNFRWACEIFQAQYGRGELANPLAIADHIKLQWLIRTVMAQVGKGKASRWKMWFQGFCLDEVALHILKEAAYKLVIAHLFDVIAGRDVEEQALPAMGEMQKDRGEDRPKRKNGRHEEHARTRRQNHGPW